MVRIRSRWVAALTLLLGVAGGGSLAADRPVSGEGAAGPGVAVSAAVARLAEQLKQHPVAPPKAGGVGLFLVDVLEGGVTRIANDPGSPLDNCGSPVWSRDGKRILFDATPGTDFSETHLMAIAPGEGRPAFTDLGAGNCPSLSPDGGQIAFMLNSSPLPGEGPGVWIMQADGTLRRRGGSYGRPRWSPDGSQLMIAGIGNPSGAALVDVESGQSQFVEIPVHRIYLTPDWAAPGILVAVVGAERGDTIALVDVTDPARAKINEVLWKRGQGLDVQPSFPVYSAATRRCVFAGTDARGMALYSVQRGGTDPPKRLEAGGYDKMIIDLAGSPDGRYVLFCSDRLERRRR